MDFVSVERVVELLRIAQEPPGYLKPPAAWPTFKGDISFDNVTIRYNDSDQPALEQISFDIKGGSTTAIIGRTGALNTKTYQSPYNNTICRFRKEHISPRSPRDK